MAGASPLSDDLDTVRQLEDAGAAAIVLRSLFEEQITREQMPTHNLRTATTIVRRGRELSFRAPTAFVLGPDEYLNHLRA